MKKIITFVALICAVASLSACGEKNDVISSQTESSVTSTSYIVDDENASADKPETGEIDTESDTAVDMESLVEENSDTENTSSKTESETSVDSTASIVESSAIEEDTEYVVSAEEVESSLSGYESEIVGLWTAQHILDSNNNEISGEEIYGTGYRQYGGTMTINSDGTFSVKMGVNTDDESTEGTFTYNGGSEISLLYYNDTSVTCERCTINGEEAIAMPLELFGDIFTVYFTLQ